MNYIVHSTTPDSITLWDGETKDPDHATQAAGLATFFIPDHDFVKGDRVNLIIRKA